MIFYIFDLLFHVESTLPIVPTTYGTPCIYLETPRNHSILLIWRRSSILAINAREMKRRAPCRDPFSSEQRKLASEALKY